MIWRRPSVWPNFMGRHVAHQFTGEVVGQRQLVGGADRTPACTKVPLLHQYLNAMPENDMGRDDLARTRIVTCGPMAFWVGSGTQRITE